MPDYTAIVEQMKRTYGLRIRKWRRSMSGVAFRIRYADGTEAAWIESPFPKTPISLAIFLHEVGHHAVGWGRFRTRAEEEFRVWLWALAKMRELGIEPDARTMTRFDRSVRYAVSKAVRRGVKQLPVDLIPYLPRAA